MCKHCERSGASCNRQRHAASSDVAGIAEQFVRARLSARALPEYPGTVPPNLETAYRCQDLALARWPDAVAGWKVARVPPAQQAQYAEERLIGPVFAPNVRVAEPGRTVDCPVFEGGFAAVEAEIVICVGRDAPRDKVEWTLDEAADFVGELCIGIEIASSPLATLNDLGAGAVVSDFGNNWGVVVGTAVQRLARAARGHRPKLHRRRVRRARRRPRCATARSAHSLSRSANAPAAAVRCSAGAVISTGMITGVHDIRPGQRSRHVFEGLGEVECRAVRATPHPKRA